MGIEGRRKMRIEIVKKVEMRKEMKVGREGGEN